MKKICARARHQARYRALQALYQGMLGGSDVNDIERHFLEDFDEKKVDVAYFKRLLRGVMGDIAGLDKVIVPYLDRDVAQLDPIELSVLRLSTYELHQCEDTPYKVVINEALELSKCFGATESHKYINGVLDRLAKELRPMEFGTHK